MVVVDTTNLNENECDIWKSGSQVKRARQEKRRESVKQTKEDMICGIGEF